MKYCLALLVCLLCVDATFARGRGRGRSSGGGSTSASQTAVVDKSPTYEVENRLLAAINVERTRYGLIPLVLDKTIHLRARRHCGWMANNNSMVHSVDGAENIAMGYGNVEAAVNGWMNSSGHRANILNPGYSLTGISAYVSPNGTAFWCQQFN
jgi:uncharacterized protein YkwD